MAKQSVFKSVALCPVLTGQFQWRVLLSLSNSENQSLGIYSICLQWKQSFLILFSNCSQKLVIQTLRLYRGDVRSLTMNSNFATFKLQDLGQTYWMSLHPRFLTYETETEYQPHRIVTRAEWDHECGASNPAIWRKLQINPSYWKHIIIKLKSKTSLACVSFYVFQKAEISTKVIYPKDTLLRSHFTIQDISGSVERSSKIWMF